MVRLYVEEIEILFFFTGYFVMILTFRSSIIWGRAQTILFKVRDFFLIVSLMCSCARVDNTMVSLEDG